MQGTQTLETAEERELRLWAELMEMRETNPGVVAALLEMQRAASETH